MDHPLSKEARVMESRDTKRSHLSKRQHTEKLCLVLRVIPQRASTLKTEYNLKQKTETIEKNRLKSDREERETKLEIGQGEKGGWRRHRH